MVIVFVCDDAPVSRLELEKKVGELLGEDACRITGFADGGQLRAALDAGERPDIVLMDIDLGSGENGISLVRNLFAGSGTQVIYVTAYMEYCTDVYETEHVYFLRKPVREDELGRALKKAVDQLGERRTTVCFQLKQGAVQLLARDILYFESRGRKAFLHTEREVYELNISLDEAGRTAGPRFVRCHQSFVVNLDRVKEFQRDRFILETGSDIPISRRRLSDTRDAFFNNLKE